MLRPLPPLSERKHMSKDARPTHGTQRTGPHACPRTAPLAPTHTGPHTRHAPARWGWTAGREGCARHPRMPQPPRTWFLRRTPARGDERVGVRAGGVVPGRRQLPFPRLTSAWNKGPAHSTSCCSRCIRSRRAISRRSMMWSSIAAAGRERAWRGAAAGGRCAARAARAACNVDRCDGIECAHAHNGLGSGGARRCVCARRANGPRRGSAPALQRAPHTIYLIPRSLDSKHSSLSSIDSASAQGCRHAPARRIAHHTVASTVPHPGWRRAATPSSCTTACATCVRACRAR